MNPQPFIFVAVLCVLLALIVIESDVMRKNVAPPRATPAVHVKGA